MEDQIQQFLYNPTVGKISTIFIGIAVIWLIIKAIQKRILSKIKDNSDSYKAKKFSTFIGYFLTIILITIVFSDKLGGLTVALGVAGAGIAFALQEVIASFAGWIVVISGGLYHTGDRVKFGGITGDVMDIGVLRTTIMETGQWVDGDLYNGRIVFIANNNVFKEPVFNYSGDFPFLWDEIKIPIQFGSNYDRVHEILLQAGKEVVETLTSDTNKKWMELQRKYRLENAKTDPMVSLIATDSWVEFTLRYVVNFKKRRATKTELHTKILKMIDDTQGEVKFTTATLQLVDPPTFNVNVASKKP